jgi:plastocyanin
VEVSPTPQALHTLDVTDVSITEAGFNPPSVTIGTSDAVRWTNNGTDTYTIRGGVPYEIYLPRVLK